MAEENRDLSQAITPSGAGLVWTWQMVVSMPMVLGRPAWVNVLWIIAWLSALLPARPRPTVITLDRRSGWPPLATARWNNPHVDEYLAI